MAEEEKVEKAPVKKTAAKKTTSSKAAASETKVAKKTTTRKTTKKAAETAEAPAERKLLQKQRANARKLLSFQESKLTTRKELLLNSLKNSVTSRSWKSHTLKRLLSIWVLEKLQATPKLSKKQWLI